MIKKYLSLLLFGISGSLLAVTGIQWGGTDSDNDNIINDTNASFEQQPIAPVNNANSDSVQERMNFNGADIEGLMNRLRNSVSNLDVEKQKIKNQYLLDIERLRRQERLLREDIGKVEAEKRELINSNRSISSHLREKVSNLDGENKNLSEELSNKTVENNELKTKISKLEQDLIKKEQDLVKKEKEFEEKYQAILKTNKNLLDNSKSKVEELKDINKEKINIEKEKLVVKSKELENIRNSKTILENEIKFLKSNLDTISSSYNEKLESEKKYKEKLSELNNKLSELNAGNIKIKNKLDAISLSYKEKLESEKIYKKGLSELNNKINKLNYDNKKIKNELSEYIEKNKKASNELNNKDKKIDKLTEEIDRKNDINRQLLEKEDELKKEIEELLSSDVDVAKVVGLRINLLDKFRSNIINDTKSKVLKIKGSIKKLNTGVKQKKFDLVLAKEKILEKYNKNLDLLSESNIGSINEISKKIEAIAIEKAELKEKYDKKIADIRKEEEKLDKVHYLKITKNEKEKEEKSRLLLDEIKKVKERYMNSLTADRKELSDLEKKKETIEVEFRNTQKELKSDTAIKNVENKIKFIKETYEKAIIDENNKFKNKAEENNLRLAKLKTQVEKIKSYLDLTSKNTAKRLKALKGERESANLNYEARKKNLQTRIEELTLAAKEVEDINKEKMKRLEEKLIRLEKEIVNITDAKMKEARQLEIKSLEEQINSLNSNLESIVEANTNVKKSFIKAIERAKENEIEAESEYKEKYNNINKENAKILENEAERMSFLIKKHDEIKEIMSKEDKEHEDNLLSIEQIYKNKGAELNSEKEKLVTKKTKDKKVKIETYKKRKEEVDDKIAILEARIQKNMGEENHNIVILNTNRDRLLEGSDYINQKMVSEYNRNKQVVEQNIAVLDRTYINLTNSLVQKEEELASKKSEIKEFFKNKIERYLSIKDKSVKDIDDLSIKLDNIKERLEKKLLNRLVELDNNKDRTVSKLNENIKILRKIYLEFEEFTETQLEFIKENKTINDEISNLLLNYSRLSGKEVKRTPVNIKKENIDTVKTQKSKSELEIEMLEDIINIAKFSKNEYVFIKGDCYKTDALGGDESNNICVSGFSISNHEVTNEEYRKFKPNHNSGSFNNKSLNNPNQPVVNISWHDAIEYSKWLSKKTGDKYRLPTNEEWEYAARGGVNNNKTFYLNESDACIYANVADILVKESNPSWDVHNCIDGNYVSSDVGTYKPNKYGLYDMLGNVWEWVCSRYESINDKLVCIGENAPKSELKVSRGGSWYSSPKSVRFGFKYGNYSSYKGQHVGFRLVKE